MQTIKRQSIIRDILVFSLLLILFVLSLRIYFRADLTKNKIYSISPYTRTVLADLDSEVTVTWYCSGMLEKLVPAARYIQDFLEEYRNYGKGHFVYSIVDPAAAGKTNTIQSLGMIPRQIEILENDGRTFRELYSGLLIEYKNRHQIIPFFIDTNTLEYDLTRLILELKDGTEKNSVGIIYGSRPSGLSDEYSYVEPWLSYAGFQVRNIPLPAKDLDVSVPLLVIGSSLLDYQTVSAIEQFIRDGGSSVFFVSGTTVNTATDWESYRKEDDIFLSYLETIGIRIEQELLLDISNFRMTMPSLDGTRYEYINYPFWIISGSFAEGRQKKIFAGIPALQFFWPSPLMLIPGTHNFLPLVSTTPAAFTMSEPFDTNPFGNQLSLFSSGEKSVKHLGAFSESRNRIIVFPDEYMISSLIEYTASDTNLDFLVNCIEWISGKDSLLELKKDGENYQMQPLDAAVESSDLLRTAVLTNIIILPVLIIVLTSLKFIRKRRTGK
ncbi:Gldg family protein [Brucepastera parasyntrophica]|uniref:GldG family protein n=1 Tax=Brucepastera parasyntrophica TaxID=2880008 RepID=UPI00210BF1BA|nr:Gldg family protein [Brucepastera parasyntrophica]ULQ60012.1 Gldg family protein [Brucepastera parasyntrophica]